MVNLTLVKTWSFMVNSGLRATMNTGTECLGLCLQSNKRIWVINGVNGARHLRTLWLTRFTSSIFCHCCWTLSEALKYQDGWQEAQDEW